MCSLVLGLPFAVFPLRFLRIPLESRSSLILLYLLIDVLLDVFHVDPLGFLEHCSCVTVLCVLCNPSRVLCLELDLYQSELS